MSQTIIQKAFAPIKQIFPAWVYNPIRSTATAIIGPWRWAYKSGYFLSCFKVAAVDKTGAPIPWYTYPCIEFLKHRDYKNKTVLEFGAGQSTLWWSKKSHKVFSLEGDSAWYEKIKKEMPENADLHLVSMESRESNEKEVEECLKQHADSFYDIIIIDGLYRESMISIAVKHLKEDGILICDNAEGYGFYDTLKHSDLQRVDFFGNSPGLVLPHCTSIYFRPSSFAFNPMVFIPTTHL
jgi:hypothetical protein